jgi:hypothetical protein
VCGIDFHGSTFQGWAARFARRDDVVESGGTECSCIESLVKAVLLVPNVRAVRAAKDTSFLIRVTDSLIGASSSSYGRGFVVIAVLTAARGASSMKITLPSATLMPNWLHRLPRSTPTGALTPFLIEVFQDRCTRRLIANPLDPLCRPVLIDRSTCIDDPSKRILQATFIAGLLSYLHICDQAKQGSAPVGATPGMCSI